MYVLISPQHLLTRRNGRRSALNVLEALPLMHIASHGMPATVGLLVEMAMLWGRGVSQKDVREVHEPPAFGMLGYL